MVTLVPLPPIAPLGIPYEEEEAVFISVVNPNEDPPNAHQAQHRWRRRRRRQSLFVV